MAKRPTEHEEAEIEPEDIGITHLKRSGSRSVDDPR